MALFDRNIFDSGIFDTGAAVSTDVAGAVAPRADSTYARTSVSDQTTAFVPLAQTTAQQLGEAIQTSAAGVLVLRAETTAEPVVIAQAEPELIGGGGRYVEDDDDRLVERDDAEVLEVASLFWAWRKAA